MKQEERLSGALQENILACICFDAKHASIARAALTPQLFESAVYREIAGIAIDFIDQYREPVGEHLPDHLEHILKGEDTRKAASYRRAVDELFLAQTGINGEYVISQLHKFVRQQNMKSAVMIAVEALEDGRVDEAEVALQKGLAHQSVAFESGIDLSNPDQALTFLDQTDKPFLTGIEALDRFDVGPARKTLFLGTGPLGKGKSWWLMQMGKFGLLQRLNVLHITLEMSAEQVTKRYMQMLFSITKRQGGARVPRITKSFDGGIKSIEFEHLDLPSLEDANIRGVLHDRITRRLARRAHFKVKKFASGSLTISMLNAYLDGLERYEGWSPDLVLLDYAELMQLDKNDKRGSTGTLFVDLRGIADDRNLALATMSQVNRLGIGKMTATEQDLSEDISKGFTVDSLVTYNQTPMEHQMGLARLFVSKNRDGEGQMTALITQNYAMGQFCLDSVVMTDRYIGSLNAARGAPPPDDDEPPTTRRHTPRR